jgi:hypothetical protein
MKVIPSIEPVSVVLREGAHLTPDPSPCEERGEIAKPDKRTRTL